ncbi:putative transferase [Halobacteriovorax marinus SJ]|uniref:Transferase n=1 Tax=Halobacteriovorax marinus (strain ATCC BAA-682 / DSM 15412 / SJ) TaxID=862908 RepID=E1X1I9_HALMS|nr:DUF3419 family protein [Halobacteriovorax marinus]CBW26580.1 putative transferase [Halobacteriovorax marinus SJ]
MVKKYFSDLNYTLGNEDTTLEYELVKKIKPKNILTIAGSGSRVVPLISKDVSNLYCVDVSRPQLFITELRKVTIESLNFNDYLAFWGFPPYAAYDYAIKRREIFKGLDLSFECKDYFLKVFGEMQWESILYMGKWERTFAVFAKVVQKFFGKEFDQIFKFHNLSDQIHYYNNKFSMRKWKTLLFILGNKSVFNALLYKGDFIKKNQPGSHFSYYFDAFESLFTHSLARESFFLNLCFFGKLSHEDANTIEAKKECFDRMKEGLSNGVNVNYVNSDLVSAAQSVPSGSLDFLSLSDVPSYFGGDLERDYMQELRPSLKKGAIVVLRSYLRVPESNLKGFVDITPKYSELLATEKVQMYIVQIFEYVGE